MYFDREYWKQMLPVVTAFANGEDVETTSFGEWECRSEFHFDSSPDSYRIKPAPKLRPWTREELEDRICRRAVVRHKSWAAVGGFSLNKEGFIRTTFGNFGAREFMEIFELIGIDGKRLPEPKPCGVRE